METTRVQISAIVADEKFNARKTYDETVLKALVKDIQKNGQLNPLLVTVHPTKPGKYFLVSGFTRYKALQEIEEETKIPQTAFAQVLTDVTEKLDLYMLNLGENVTRKDLTPYDIAMRVTEMSDEFELSGTQIANRVNLAAGTVNNYIRIIHNVIPEILAEFKDKHPQAATDKLIKIAAMKTEEEQRAAWDMYCGKVPVDEDSGEDDTGTGNGAGAGKGEDGAVKAKRASEAKLVAAILAIRGNDDLSADVKKAVLGTLKFCLGQAKTIPGIYNPAKPAKTSDEAQA